MTGVFDAPMVASVVASGVWRLSGFVSEVTDMNASRFSLEVRLAGVGAQDWELVRSQVSRIESTERALGLVADNLVSAVRTRVAEAVALFTPVPGVSVSDVEVAALFASAPVLAEWSRALERDLDGLRDEICDSAQELVSFYTGTDLEALAREVVAAGQSGRGEALAASWFDRVRGVAACLAGFEGRVMGLVDRAQLAHARVTQALPARPSGPVGSDLTAKRAVVRLRREQSAPASAVGVGGDAA